MTSTTKTATTTTATTAAIQTTRKMTSIGTTSQHDIQHQNQQQQQQQQQSSSALKVKRGVHFQLSMNVLVDSNIVLSQDDIGNVWWKKDDYVRFRKRERLESNSSSSSPTERTRMLTRKRKMATTTTTTAKTSTRTRRGLLWTRNDSRDDTTTTTTAINVTEDLRDNAEQHHPIPTQKECWEMLNMPSSGAAGAASIRTTTSVLPCAFPMIIQDIADDIEYHEENDEAIFKLKKIDTMVDYYADASGVLMAQS